MNRKKERKIVFEIAFTIPFKVGKSPEEIMEIYSRANDLGEFSTYITSTVTGIYNNIEFIDQKIQSSIKSRRFERLDNVCLTAMRYATYEIFFADDIPDTVAINEAIELTKLYDDSLSAFVHGNLGIISKSKNE